MYKEDSQELFLLIQLSKNGIQVISILIISEANVIWLSHYKFTLVQSYSAIIFLVYLISRYFYKTNLLLEVKCLNWKGLSLYIWLGYNILQQRNFYYNQAENWQYILYNNQKKSKIFWRRLLILSS